MKGKIRMYLNDDRQPISPEDVRNAVFQLLGNNEVPTGVAEQALQQCLCLLRDTRQIRTLAGDLGLELSGFRWDEKLEVYYDVSHQGRDIGFVYKGWDDPGFGIGETIEIPADNMCLFWAQKDAILHPLASNGIAVTARSTPDGGYWLEMTTVIYKDGFNANTLAEALGTIAKSAAAIREMVS